MPKRIPITAAKKLAKELGLKQVILFAWDGLQTHVVTYGANAEDCDQAAQGGAWVKKIMGWPRQKVFPSRVKALQKRVAELEAALAKERRTPRGVPSGDPYDR